MSVGNASYQPPGGPWETVPPAASVPRPARPFPPPVLSALLLAAAGVLGIVSTFLTATRITDRLLTANSYWGESHSRVDIITSTAWSITATVPSRHAQQPLDGWGFVMAGAVALTAAALLLVGRGQWSWTRPLAAAAGGLLAGVILAALLGLAGALSTAFTDASETLQVSAGPAVWLQLPAGLLAVAVAALALAPGLAATAGQG